MKRLHLFPIKEQAQVVNPHMVELTEVLKRQFHVVNQDDPLRFGIVHHPVRMMDHGASCADKPASDIRFWSIIKKDKGIDTLPDCLFTRGVLDKYRIILAGRVTLQDLLKKMKPLIKKAKLVVLTCHTESVLNFGLLVDPLAQPACIKGPETRVFRDLSQLGMIEMFGDYQQLLDKIGMYLNPDDDHHEQGEGIEHFIIENTWGAFTTRIHDLIEALMQPVSVI